MTSVYGYIRVSTTDQDLDVQRDAMIAAGCIIICEEKKSGTSSTNWTELRTLLDCIRKGDSLVVTRIDRLARSIADLQVIVAELKVKGATLRCTEQPVDTSTAAGMTFLDMLRVFAEFETNLRRERQMEGIAKAKKDGVYSGRKASIPADQVCAMAAEGVAPSVIAKRLGVSRASVHRILTSQRAVTAAG